MDDRASVDSHLSRLSEIAKRFAKYLPKRRPPVIMITGKVGNGKTTTINTLFGQKVGTVGHVSRGTSTDRVYEWESKGQNIHLIDVPGLGDSTENDEKVIREIYNKRVREADAFLVVICPPRFAEEGTLKTIKALLTAGVDSNHIIFGFNKLGYLNYTKDEHDSTVVLNGLGGPASDQDTQVIQKAKEEFLRNLHQHFAGVPFSLDQVVEYDSKSGWHLYEMLHAVLEIVPFETVSKLRYQVRAAHEEIVDLEKKQIGLLEAERKAAEEKVLMKFEAERIKFESDSLRKALTGIAIIIESVDPKAGSEFRSNIDAIATTIDTIGEKVADELERFVTMAENAAEKVNEAMYSAKNKIKAMWDGFTALFD